MQKRVGEYLVDCLHASGIDQIFGVPGDFNLAFLDDIIGHESVEWVGNTNELNASYAADGYARMKGISALVTTFGVGELSAVNGIAGAYAERVPIVAITGAPTTEVERAGKYVHHSLGEGTFDNYRKMFQQITIAQGYITTENAEAEIPRLINAALAEKRPVHVHLPIDVATTKIEIKTAYRPTKRIPTDFSDFAHSLLVQLNKAKRPLIIAGHEINSFHLQAKLEQFVEKTHIPVAQLSLGKSAFNEESPCYIGIYDGSIANENIRDYVDSSDFILNIGAKLTDSATAGFSYQFNLNNVTMLNHRNFKLGDTETTSFTLEDMLDALNSLDYHNKATFPTFKATINSVETNNKPLTQKDYFAMMQSFIQPNDIILAEQGTSFFGAYDLTLYQSNTFIAQPLWGSIGYTLPATIGTQMSNRSRRNLLLIGDGSLQLTAQDIATMIRQNLKPIIFVINNDGYTVERKIHGEHQPYNDIKMWDYKLLPAAFGGKDDVTVHDVTTSAELADVFTNINNHPEKMHLVEVKMDVADAPEKLVAIGQVFAKQNS